MIQYLNNIIEQNSGLLVIY